MRILHTADWHLGKKIEHRDRLGEQRAALSELAAMARDSRADAVLVCGDVFDTYLPSADAEDLFYEGLCGLSEGGARLVAVIAGNHDDALRLSAAAPIAERQGIVLGGDTLPRAFKGFSVTKSCGTGFQAAFKSGAECSFNALPYPTAARLSEFDKENALYTARIAALLTSGNTLFTEKGLNVTMSHLFMTGGTAGGGEREIELGGLNACAPDAFSPLSSYVALGHLHRVQNPAANAWYSGSLLQYAADEPGDKCALLTELAPGQAPVVHRLPLTSGKRIAAVTADSPAEALAVLDKAEGYVALTVRCRGALAAEDVRRLRAAPALVSLAIEQLTEDGLSPLPASKKGMTPREIFCAHYQKTHNASPPDALVNLFLDVLNNES